MFHHWCSGSCFSPRKGSRIASHSSPATCKKFKRIFRLRRRNITVADCQISRHHKTIGSQRPVSCALRRVVQRGSGFLIAILRPRAQFSITSSSSRTHKQASRVTRIMMPSHTERREYNKLKSSNCTYHATRKVDRCIQDNLCSAVRCAQTDRQTTAQRRKGFFLGATEHPRAYRFLPRIHLRLIEKRRFNLTFALPYRVW